MIYFSRDGRIADDAVGGDRGKWNEYEPVFVARDLLDAAKWIVAEGLKGEKARSARAGPSSLTRAATAGCLFFRRL